jgi:pseudouridine kinase
VDITGRSAADLRLRDSNPAKVHIGGGGVARNIACNLSYLGAKVSLVSAIGDDGFGKLLRDSLAEAGLDDSRLILRRDHSSGLYLVLLEPSGKLFVAVNDMAAVESITAAEVEALGDLAASSDLIITDANLRPGALEALAEAAGKVPLMADAVSESKVGRLKGILPRLGILKANRAEAAVLAGLPLDTAETLREGCKRLLDTGLGGLYITLGEQGCCCASRDGFFTQDALPAKLVNVNGAGDSFAAGVAYSYCLGQTPRENAIFGAACAAITLECNDGVCKTLTRDGVWERAARYRLKTERGDV